MNIPPLSDELEINGVRLSGTVLGHLLNIVTQPDPTRWFNFRREGDMVLVTCRQDPPTTE